ncbi:MAG: baseplate J/gp47 family protein [Chromatiales bacterium]
MSAVISQDHVDDRADVLEGRNLNGMRLALVTLPTGPSPDHAVVDLRFYNALHVADILAEITADPARAGQIFRVRGGTRIPAGSATGQVRVTAVTGIDPEQLLLRIEPVGDYSTYTLELVWDASRIDPFFSTLGFKFRPGCFTNDCAPSLPGRPAAPGPVIDYLAKDYDSFRHTLMTAMAERVPAWQSTSEADHDQVLIDLFAAAADELSDFQDRVMSEAYLATTRKRVSLARHARLVDYHLHEGNQASTWLAVEVLAGQAPFTLSDQELVVWTGADPPLPESDFFTSRQRRLKSGQRQHLDPLLNRLRLHTWGNAQPALRAGATSADLVPTVAGPTEADRLRDLVRNGLVRELLIAEQLNPLTGNLPGRNPRKRQLLRLHSGTDAAETLFDPVTLTWLVRVHWRPEDALRFDYSFTTFCNGAPVENISMLFGNVVPVYEGRPMTVHFYEGGIVLPTETPTEKHRHYRRLERYGGTGGWVLAELPDEGPLAYLPTPVNGEVPARSTLHVEIEPPGAPRDPWDEVESLVHSDDSPESGDHFMVETDEHQQSVLRFGNGTNGRLLPAGAVVHTEYQIGGGARGNVGADQLTHVRALTGALSGAIVAVWNPFDVTDGRDPELADKVRRNAPEAYRARQLRAITLADYARRAEEVEGVTRAVARYAWTGSWRTVRVVIDPGGTTELTDALRTEVAAHLEAVRLIGEDLELRPPRFVPLEIYITVCAAPEYWIEDLRFVLEQEFSDSWTSDGRRGFFHPDEWSFGQALHRSAIEGRIHQVAGIKHVVSITMKRFNASTPGVPNSEVLEIGFDEVVLLANDPDHLERGLIRFDVQGGRQ